MYTKVAARDQVSPSIRQKLADYGTLVKFRLNVLVVFSAVMAYMIAGDRINWIGALVLGLGGFLVTGAANALNQVLERDTDSLMKRTENRPIATGRMSVSEGVMAAGFMSLFGILLLSMFNPWAALLGTISLIIYAFVYTPMKKVSSLAVLVGAIPGALPMMIGCVAIEGELTMLAIALFAIQFFWQFPHFWAIAWLAFEDYSKAGFHLLPSERGVRNNNAGLQSFYYTLLLLPASLLPMFLGQTGIISTIVVIMAGAYYGWCAWRFYREETRATARRLMFCSFIYLPVVLFALFFDKI